MTPPNNQSQEVLRECPACKRLPRFHGGSEIRHTCEVFNIVCEIRTWNRIASSEEITPQEPPKHCSTCKHFKRIYPENKQLGICEYLEVTNLQPCGHMIDRPPIASDKFVPAKGYNICINRMMDSFGCVYHCPKEKGGEVKQVNPFHTAPVFNEHGSQSCPEQQSDNI